GAQYRSDLCNFNEIAVLVCCGHGRFSVANPRVEKAYSFCYMDPGQQGGVARFICGSVRQQSLDIVVDSAYARDRCFRLSPPTIGGQGYKTRRAPQPSMQVSLKVRMVPHSCKDRRVQHLQ